MEIVTLIYLSGAITGTVMGDAFDPLSLNEPDTNVNKQCSITRVADKQYNFEINDYIENVKILVTLLLLFDRIPIYVCCTKTVLK